MKTTVVLALSALCALAAGGALAQETGRVLSSTPIIQQVAVPQQVCGSVPMAVQTPNSGAGAVMGALAGGALGNAVGAGAGRAVATMIGVIGGAAVGNQIEGAGSTQVVPAQQCTTQTTYENRAVAYNVVYEYAGKQYSVQMPNDPGPFVQLQVTPVGAMAPQPPVQAYAPPATVVAAAAPVVSYPYPVAAPYPYYGYNYYAPAAVGLAIGLGVGYGYRGGYHRHWR